MASTTASDTPDHVRAIIDTHVHIWDRTAPWMSWLADRPASWEPVRDDFPWSRLRGELDAAGVAELVLVQAGTSVRETQQLLTFAQSEATVRGVVGWVRMTSPAATEADLDALDGGHRKLVGVRALHRWEPDGEILAADALVESCRTLADRGLVLDLFVNDHTELALILPIVEAVPEGRFVIDHLGRPPIGRDRTAQRIWSDQMTRLARCPQVYVKYSGWATEVARVRADDVAPYAELVLSTFGAARTMYASNWPVALVGGSYAQTFEATRESLSGLSVDDLDQVLAGTATRCYLPS